MVSLAHSLRVGQIAHCIVDDYIRFNRDGERIVQGAQDRMGREQLVLDAHGRWWARRAHSAQQSVTTARVCMGNSSSSSSKIVDVCACKALVATRVAHGAEACVGDAAGNRVWG